MVFETYDILLLINRLIFCYSLVPLFYKNYQLKTARGLSDGLTWMLLNAYIGLAFYAFCLGLPKIYSMSSLVQIGIMSAIAAQRFWYDDFSYKLPLGILYIANVFVALVLIPIACAQPHVIGNAAGWITAFLFSANRIPQIVKIQRARSVYGFSYWFALLLGVGCLMEFILSIVYHLPLQTLLMSIWAFIAFLIFTAQFYFFSWRKHGFKLFGRFS